MKKWHYNTLFFLSFLAATLPVTYGTEQKGILSRDFQEYENRYDQFEGNFFWIWIRFRPKGEKEFIRYRSIFVNFDTDPLCVINALGGKVKKGERIALMIDKINTDYFKEAFYIQKKIDKNATKGGYQQINIDKFFEYDTMKRMIDKNGYSFESYTIDKIRKDYLEQVDFLTQDETIIISKEGSTTNASRYLTSYKGQSSSFGTPNKTENKTKKEETDKTQNGGNTGNTKTNGTKTETVVNKTQNGGNTGNTKTNGTKTETVVNKTQNRGNTGNTKTNGTKTETVVNKTENGGNTGNTKTNGTKTETVVNKTENEENTNSTKANNVIDNAQKKDLTENDNLGNSKSFRYKEVVGIGIIGVILLTLVSFFIYTKVNKQPKIRRSK